MREILFRGYSAAYRKWFYGDLLHCSDGLRIANEESFVEVSEKSVGQYTGLTDKNGKKIFEGDICDMSILGGDHTLVEIIINYGCVGFEPLYPDKVHPDDREWNSFWKSDEQYLFDTNYFTIIGNIYNALNC